MYLALRETVTMLLRNFKRRINIQDKNKQLFLRDSYQSDNSSLHIIKISFLCECFCPNYHEVNHSCTSRREAWVLPIPASSFPVIFTKLDGSVHIVSPDSVSLSRVPQWVRTAHANAGHQCGICGLLSSRLVMLLGQ